MAAEDTKKETSKTESGSTEKKSAAKASTEKKSAAKASSYAIFRSGGKQYTVEAGDVVQIEKIAGASGDAVTFDEVLLVNGTPGTPLVSGAAVKGTILDTKLGSKVLIFKKRRRKGSKKLRGHRQPETSVRIESIAG